MPVTRLDLLPSANVVYGKVMFSVVSVSQSVIPSAYKWDSHVTCSNLFTWELPPSVQDLFKFVHLGQPPPRKADGKREVGLRLKGLLCVVIFYIRLTM